MKQGDDDKGERGEMKQGDNDEQLKDEDNEETK
jgi:hypothetical protein